VLLFKDDTYCSFPLSLYSYNALSCGCFILQVIEEQIRVEKAREAELDLLYQ